MNANKAKATPRKKAAPAAKAAARKTSAAAPAKKATPSRPAAAARKTPARAGSRPAATARGRDAAARPSAGGRGSAPIARSPQEGLQARLGLLQVEKSELQEIVRRLRAERDSALAEGERLGARVRDLETEQTRRSATEPQKAGPGGFDPAIDLEEDAANSVDDDFEGTAGFFDRMDEIRARRLELDRERNDRELEQSEQPYWMVCPKCGDLMEEQESESIKLERCDNCGGLYLDRGEADLLVSLTSDRDGVRRLHNALKF